MDTVEGIQGRGKIVQHSGEDQLSTMKRYSYIVGGQVQGVGFRPFVYRLARQYRLTGHVGNTSEGVSIEVQGEENQLRDFEHALHEELPPLAQITSLQRSELATRSEENAFEIAASRGHHGHAVLVSPDVATCDRCLEDMRDPSNRRYRYPFTNCTDCGPRYTITHSIPYDRATTSMSCFPLCPQCAEEYADPGNRRFHAQPNACPECGPQIWLTDSTGKLMAKEQKALNQLASLLASGHIAAIKGLGGFHLVCSAVRGEGDQAIEVLRSRKGRPHKSLAIMVPDLKTAQRVAEVSPLEAAVLNSPEHPIVSLKRLPGMLPESLAPDLHDIGLMLPYTPLHHLLLEAFGQKVSGIPALVMTSGNAGGEPIALGNREALHRLNAIADCFLLHNRDILVRADDSVVSVVEPCSAAAKVLPRTAAEAPLHFFRRARGFVPRPHPLLTQHDRPIPSLLATGAELKNTICLTRDRLAFVSQHIGDLKNPETYAFFGEMVEHLARLLEVSPVAAVCDCHPDYLSTAYALESGLPVLRLQHHFAHIYSVLAEHGYEDPALGLALDGTGFGLDGTIWGGELLHVHPAAVRSDNTVGERLGRLSPFPLPGGEAAIREPWRIAVGILGLAGDASLTERLLEEGNALFLSDRSPAINLHLLPALLELSSRRLSPMTSSCGRLFDAVAALLGLCPAITYEGQAAIRLEQIQDQSAILLTGSRLFDLVKTDGLLELDVPGAFKRLFQERLQGTPVPVLARWFHEELAEGLAELALAGAHETGIRTIAISGGVLHNRTLANLLPAALLRRGLVPLLHRTLPPGDGSIAYGQAAWGIRAIS